MIIAMIGAYLLIEQSSAAARKEDYHDGTYIEVY